MVPRVSRCRNATARLYCTVFTWSGQNLTHFTRITERSIVFIFSTCSTVLSMCIHPIRDTASGYLFACFWAVHFSTFWINFSVLSLNIVVIAQRNTRDWQCDARFVLLYRPVFIGWPVSNVQSIYSTLINHYAYSSLPWSFFLACTDVWYWNVGCVCYMRRPHVF